MQDFFLTGTTVSLSTAQLQNLFHSIYDWRPQIHQDVFLGLNLQWPQFDLPPAERYFISFHTEQADIHWIVAQAQRVYPKPMLIAYDGSIDSSVLPNNVQVVRWITWHQQLAQLVDQFGVCTDPQLPQYKLSSLSYRLSQYKTFITAYLLAHAQPTDIVLTHHHQVMKPEDLHGYPAGISWLDQLDLDLKHTLINFDDDFAQQITSPVINGGWHNPAYTNALVNCTNESFHYSQSTDFVFPGPYITEKTWKPLLAGRPFVSVAQWHVYSALEELGLSFDFGFDRSFDSDPGDLTRIRDIFGAIDQVLNTTTQELYEHSLPAVRHNVNWIQSGAFADQCCTVNQVSQQIINEFIK